MSSSSASKLEHCRAVLLRVVNGLSNEQLDFLLFPDSKSLGETLLHIAGFEFLMIAGAGYQASGTPDHRLWQRLKPGFSREAGFPPPRATQLDDYVDLLAEVHESAIRYFTVHEDPCLVAKPTFPIVELTARLRDNDPAANSKQYKDLAACVGASFKDDGAENERGETDLASLLLLHETYHRGQITLLKYLYARSYPRRRV